MDRYLHACERYLWAYELGSASTLVMSMMHGQTHIKLVVMYCRLYDNAYSDTEDTRFLQVRSRSLFREYEITVERVTCLTTSIRNFVITSHLLQIKSIGK